MTNFNETRILLDIQQMIEQNACSIDGFFTDSKTAASDILKYLVSEKIIIKSESAVEIEFKERHIAA